MPESRQKYLYERLGDHDFQLLINALLIEQFPDFRPLPLRQAEGGRDGVVLAGEKLLISQVKWSVHGRERNPVAWLEQAVKGEEQNITRLIAQGATRFTSSSPISRALANRRAAPSPNSTRRCRGTASGSASG